MARSLEESLLFCYQHSFGLFWWVSADFILDKPPCQSTLHRLNVSGLWPVIHVRIFTEQDLWTVQIVPTTFQYDKNFTQFSSNETNQAWDSLFPSRGAFFKHPTIAPVRSTISAYHQLHCLASSYLRLKRTITNMILAEYHPSRLLDPTWSCRWRSENHRWRGSYIFGTPFSSLHRPFTTESHVPRRYDYRAKESNHKRGSRFWSSTPVPWLESTLGMDEQSWWERKKLIALTRASSTFGLLRKDRGKKMIWNRKIMLPLADLYVHLMIPLCSYNNLSLTVIWTLGKIRIIWQDSVEL